MIVDTNVTDYQSLIAGLQSGIEAVILDPTKDGIKQITRVLANRSNIANIHIISHGSPGCLYLGNAELSLSSLDRYAEYLKGWFLLATPQPQLLLYGCNVAAGDAGEEFIVKLKHITGTEIAASTTRIGNQALGGNWELDAQSRNMDVTLAFRAETTESYSDVLVSLDFSNNPANTESGTAGQVGAVYRFEDVTTGIDALVEIVDITGGAVLETLDITNDGELNALQPKISGIPSNEPAIEFTITFVEAGTSTPTVAPDFKATWVDLDGSSNYTEFGEFSDFVQYTFESGTDIDITGTGPSFRRFAGASSTFSGINTTDTTVMVTADYTAGLWTKKIMFANDLREHYFD